MKHFFTLILVIIIGIGAVSHHKKKPELMLEEFQKAAESSGDVREFLTDDANSLFDKVDEGGSILSEIGLLSEKQVTSIIVKHISDIGWELKDVDHSKKSGTAEYEFEYDGVIDIVGTIEFSLVKVETEAKFPKSLFVNEWKIDGINKVKF